MSRPDRAFWRGRRVLLTGHTGFKGAWLTLLLTELGAELVGVALAPAELSLFGLLAARLRMREVRLDIRDGAKLQAAVREAAPSVVLHLAAQALVPASFTDPTGTFETNVGGTVNLLQAVRGAARPDAVVVVTSDKVYRQGVLHRPFREADPLGGHDPYSASKAGAELAVQSWRASFTDLPPLTTARAGNVIGGGDFAETRLIPDIVEAVRLHRPLRLRHPQATRPWQHVLDPLVGYLLLAEHLVSDPGDAPAALNFGPTEAGVTVARVVAMMGKALGSELVAEPAQAVGPEAKALALDASLAHEALGWTPRLNGADAVAATGAWYAAWMRGEDMVTRSLRCVAEVLA